MLAAKAATQTAVRTPVNDVTLEPPDLLGAAVPEALAVAEDAFSLALEPKPAVEDVAAVAIVVEVTVEADATFLLEVEVVAAPELTVEIAVGVATATVVAFSGAADKMAVGTVASV